MRFVSLIIIATHPSQKSEPISELASLVAIEYNRPVPLQQGHQRMRETKPMELCHAAIAAALGRGFAGDGPKSSVGGSH